MTPPRNETTIDPTDLEAIRASRSDMQVVVDTALASAEPNDVDPESTLIGVIPTDAKAVVYDLERFLDTPRRATGTTELHTADSLAAYVNAHKGDATALYVDVYERRLEAVLNDDDGQDPLWRDWRAVLALRHTEQWNRWAAIDGKYVSQEDFAELVEERIEDIAVPSGAELLEIATTFSAKTGVNFRSAVVLTSGQRQLTWHETIDATAGPDGDLIVPAELTLVLTPFEGEGEPQGVTAKLRYRINNGALAIGVKLVNAEDVIRDAFEAEVTRVETDTALSAFRGRAPGAHASPDVMLTS